MIRANDKKDEEVRVDYDEDHDILYLRIGKPTPSEAEDIADNVYVDYDAFTNKLVGATIIGYSKKSKEWLAKILPKKLGKHLPSLTV